MATTLFFQNTASSMHRGTNSAKLNGVATGWRCQALTTARGSVATSAVENTVSGATNGVEVAASAGVEPFEWISPPLGEDVTISGTVTFNLWMAESDMAANIDAQCVIERLDHLGAIISTVTNSEKNTELPVTTAAAQNWTATPTSTAFNKGDRIRIRVAANDQTTMVTGHTFTFRYHGPTAAADGDSYVTFTETFSLMTATPAGSTLYLTNVAGPAVGAAIEKEMWTARGDGVDSIVVNTAAGWTAPVQWTDAAGGTVVEWYSKPLQAFTLAERVRFNMRVLQSDAAATASVRAELAVTNGDGSNVVVWAAANYYDSTNFGELGTAENARFWLFAGDDVAVTNGQRLRLWVFIDDISTAAMVTGHTATLFYDGTSSGASGDSFIILTQTVSEFVAAVPVPPKPTIVNFAATRASTY